MRIVVLCLAIFLGCSVGVVGADLELAKQAYDERRYSDAYELYEGMLERHGASSKLFYNLGTVSYQMGDNGKAIYYFRGALLADPFFSEATHNLALALDRRVDYFPADVSLGPLYWLSLNGWVFVLLVLLSACHGLVWFWLKRRDDATLKNALAIVSGLCVVVLIFVGIRFWGDVILDKGIVVEKKVALRSGPSTTFDVLAYVHDGAECRVIKTLPRWLEIQLPSGVKGWVNDRSLWVY